jgi:hypothetical protein
MHKFLFYNKFITRLYMFRALCAHHQEVKLYYTASGIATTCRWPSGAQVQRGLYSFLFYSIPLYSIPFYSILFYSIPFYSILFYSFLFHSILLYSIIFYSILFYSILFYSILLYSSLNLCTGRPPTGVTIPDAV